MCEFVDAFLAEDTDSDTLEYHEIRTSKLKEFKFFLQKMIKEYDDIDNFLEDYPCNLSDKLVDKLLFEQKYKDYVLYKEIYKCFYVEETVYDNEEYLLLRSLPEKIFEYKQYLLRKYQDETLDIISDKEDSEFCFRRADQSYYEHLEEVRIEHEELCQELNNFEAQEKEIIKNFHDRKISEKDMKDLLNELNIDFFVSLES